MRRMTLRIGSLASPDDTFARRVLERAGEAPDIETQPALIGGTSERHVSRYDALLDRLSHRVPHYRAYLRAAALSGAVVVNDPFWTSAEDSFFALSLAARSGIDTVRAALLPHKEYDSGVDPSRDLGNLEYPVPWEQVVEFVGLPALLRPADRSELEPLVVKSVGELWSAFDTVGRRVVMLTQHLPMAQRVSAHCVGERCRLQPHDGDELDAALATRISEAAVSLGKALGFEIHSSDFGVTSDQVLLLSGSDPYAAFEPAELGDETFDELTGWAVELLRLAARRRQPPERHRWQARLV
jgi:hypothetical protein